MKEKFYTILTDKYYGEFNEINPEIIEILSSIPEINNWGISLDGNFLHISMTKNVFKTLEKYDTLKPFIKNIKVKIESHKTIIHQ